MTFNVLLQSKWSLGYGPHFEGIVFDDGRAIPYQCRKRKEGKRILVDVLPQGETTMQAFDASEEPWVQLTELHRVESPSADTIVSCGEGAMGNEGFLAVSELSTGRLRWIAFFLCSNPFIDVRLWGGEIIAEDSLERLWSLSFEEPWNIKVSDAFENSTPSS